MAFLDIFKNKEQSKDSQNKSFNMYAELGIVEPFTILAGSSQFSNFISSLGTDRVGLLNQAEKDALDVLWNVACIDIDGFGNNIWNLKKGSFEVFNQDGVSVSYEKRDAEVKDSFGDEYVGRANFVFSSPEGSLVINQNSRNKEAFLVYVSNNVSERLLTAFRKAEEYALEIESVVQNEKVGIPDSTVISIDNPDENVGLSGQGGPRR